MQRLSTPSRALFAPAAVMAAILFGSTAVACDDAPTVPKPPTYVATMNGANEFPAKTVAGTGSATIVKTATTFNYTINYTGLTGNLMGAHIHGPAAPGVNAGILVPFTVAAGGVPATGTLTGTFSATSNAAVSLDSLEVLMKNGNAYVNLHTAANVGGEIRGQLSLQP